MHLALVQVYKDTIHQCTKYGASPELKSGSVSKLYQTLSLDIPCEPKYEDMHVSIINEDTFEAAKLYVSDGNVVILNMASCYKAGGGVNNGAMAQEEELFRRSNYFRSLSDNLYPLDIGDTIYTPKVTIIKNKKYEMLSAPFTVSAIAAAGLRKPILDKKGMYDETDQEYMTEIIDNIFKVAYVNKHDILILGALGCGAYGNPPSEVIKIFNACLKKYWGCFRRIVFAVYSKNNHDVNFTMFSSNIVTEK